MRNALTHLIAGAMVVAVALLVAGWCMALASNGHEAFVPVWGDVPPARWFLFVDRSSCGVGRVRTIDYDALSARLADRRLLGFRYAVGDDVRIARVTGPLYHGPAGRDMDCFRVVAFGVPILLAVPMLAWFPTVHWRRALQLRRRRRLGLCLCLACGYDLRASTTGVCPECGGVAQQPVTAGSPRTPATVRRR